MPLTITELQKKLLKNDDLITKLNENNEVSGYKSPSGKITYNKIVDKSNFGYFSDIITSIVPFKIINDPDENSSIPSISTVLNDTNTLKIYKQYLILNATIDIYMDYQDEEDQENMSTLLEELSTLPFKTAIAGLAIQKNEQMESAHAIAFITWKVKKNKYKFAYYDPLAYKRGAKNSFDYTDRAFVKDRFSENIEFIDLNKYCFKTSDENFHCSQYIINSEYCYILSVYFLYKWIEFGGKLHRATFRKSIVSTYIVEPSKLTRANNRESMIYRVVMMAFICQTFLSFLKNLSKDEKKIIKKSSVNISRIKNYLKEFKGKYGFDLIG